MTKEDKKRMHDLQDKEYKSREERNEQARLEERYIEEKCASYGQTLSMFL